MSRMLGDYHSGCVLYDLFTTVNPSGVPTALAGTPAPFLVAYKDAFAGSSCTVTGLVLSRDCGGLTGVHGWSVDTNQDPGFYACGHDYQIVIRGGTVGGNCVSGYVIARFSLNKQSSLRPVIHGRNCVGVTPSGKLEVDSCAAIFSVQRVVDPDTILDQGIVQPTAIFTWPGSLRAILAWLGALASNEIKQEAGQQGVCNRAATSTIAKATTTDDGTTATRGSFT